MSLSLTMLATKNAYLASGTNPKFTENPYDGLGGMKIDPYALPSNANPGWDVEKYSAALVNIAFNAQVGFRAIWVHCDMSAVDLNDTGVYSISAGGLVFSYTNDSINNTTIEQFKVALQAQYQIDMLTVHATGTVTWVGDSIVLSIPTNTPGNPPIVSSVNFEAGVVLGTQGEIKSASAAVYGKPKIQAPMPIPADSYKAVAVGHRLLKNLGAIPETGYLELMNVAPLSHVHIVISDIVNWVDPAGVGTLFVAAINPSV